ncbi:hypothetical protein AB6A40_005964 [Gnathostoma spinigerum]|uniref:DEAD/DEAH box helicase n=1 Tax=Gnathostoma spinigerum TaxID=75299 RepID=A0ABD6EI51_9BILA
MVRCQGCRGTSKRFEALESAVLMASLVNAKRGTDRKYLCEANSVSQNIGVDTIGDRRVLLAACSSLLDSIDPKSLSFSLADLWDGRLILDIYDELVKNRPILPYRIQKDFAALHASLKMKLSIAVDTDDRLFDAPSEKALLLDDCDLLPVRNPVLTKYVSEYLTLIDEKALAEKPDVFDGFNRVMEWPFYVIEEKFLKPEKNDDTMQQQRSKNKARQHLSRWYELFSQSLEGRGSKLLVDFSRTPRGFASLESEENLENDKKKKQWQQKSKGIKGKKEPGKSKKDLILEMSKAKKNEKLIETEKSMIGYAVQQDQNAVESLANLMSKLELEESKALCVFEQVKRMYNQLADYEGKELIEERRFHSVQLVGKIKSIFTEYWSFLDERQKDFVTDLWTMLGFEKTAKIGTYTEDKFSLKINLIYYQLSYGGEIIDIQSDPRKDGRVTGFHPDAWQRLMLDAVDRNHSAIIIAPTSAGKTFVSYYCIEKVLRQSDEDMVVYVSPSKALLNQASGSIYARFRNKALSGGKCLMGNLTQEFSENAMNCQVLVTIPECLEELLLSPNPLVQQVVAKIKYVIFDEVHSISASAAAHIWEHLLLLIRCPFLALSATVGNAKVLHDWLQSAEQRKNVKEGKPRKVELIEYNERYSELELSLNCIKQDVDLTVGEESGQHEVLKHFMPYCVYKPEKLAMFGIPDDQQLTARQILDLYKAMASVDEKTRDDLEPCNFFNYKPGDKPVWLSRSDIRRLESALKRRLLDWLGTDRQKVDNVLSTLGTGVQSELDYRSRPFSQWNTVVKNITSVVLELRANNQLPAICFNDDRRVCERLALHVFNYFDAQQRDFENSAEFKIKYEIKDEDKLMKIARRKRDLKEATKKKKKTRNEWEEDGREEQEREGTDDIDPLAAKRMRLAQVLERFKLRSHIRDDDLYTKMTDRLTRYGGRSRESTALLLKLFERGIGFHHQGLSAIERGAVEILFRSGQLTLIFSTSTLALGMNMPCKTVIFGVDTMSLTPLQFRQMSGRAGRRGFDHSGTVIFMSIPTSKVRRLLTASLSTLRGNVPFTTSFVLRLFSFLHQQGTSHADEHVGDLKAEKLAYIQRLETVLTLLENSFILYTRENIADASRKQLKLFTLFSVELLRSLDLLNEKVTFYFRSH